MHFPYPRAFKKEAEYSIEEVGCHINKNIRTGKMGLLEGTHRFWKAAEDFGQ